MKHLPDHNLQYIRLYIRHCHISIAVHSDHVNAFCRLKGQSQSYPAHFCHLMNQLLKPLFLRLDLDKLLQLGIRRYCLIIHEVKQ